MVSLRFGAFQEAYGNERIWNVAIHTYSTGSAIFKYLGGLTSVHGFLEQF